MALVEPNGLLKRACMTALQLRMVARHPGTDDMVGEPSLGEMDGESGRSATRHLEAADLGE